MKPPGQLSDPAKPVVRVRRTKGQRDKPHRAQSTPSTQRTSTLSVFIQFRSRRTEGYRANRCVMAPQRTHSAVPGTGRRLPRHLEIFVEPSQGQHAFSPGDLSGVETNGCSSPEKSGMSMIIRTFASLATAALAAVLAQPQTPAPRRYPRAPAPSYQRAGQAVTLTWATKDPTNSSIDSDLGRVTPRGVREIRPVPAARASTIMATATRMPRYPTSRG